MQQADEQAALWNGVAGHAWVESQELLDRLFTPFEDLLVAAARAQEPRHVLDVGCGTGATTLAVARALGDAGRCVGIDISEPMIAAARERAKGTSASFVVADAQRHAFAPASFDLIVSRFGVMFFDDFVGAFANLRRAARAGAGLRFIAWQGSAENPFMTVAERAAAPFLPGLPPRVPGAAGQFALADRTRIHDVLKQSGWSRIDVQPLTVPCAFPEKDLVRYFTRLGPLGRVLHEVDEETRGRVLTTVRAAFEPYVHGAQVRFTAACWMVAAKA